MHVRAQLVVIGCDQVSFLWFFADHYQDIAVLALQLSVREARTIQLSKRYFKIKDRVGAHIVLVKQRHSIQQVYLAQGLFTQSSCNMLICHTKPLGNALNVINR